MVFFQEVHRVEALGAMVSLVAYAAGHVDVGPVPDRDVVVRPSVDQQLSRQQRVDRLRRGSHPSRSARDGKFKRLSAEAPAFTVRSELQQAGRGQRLAFGRVVRSTERVLRFKPSSVHAAQTHIGPHCVAECAVHLGRSDGGLKLTLLNEGEEAALVLSHPGDDSG